MSAGTPITISSSMALAAAAIRDSTAIATFCTANYSTTIKIFTGEAASARASEEDAPFVVITPPVSADYDVGVYADQRKPGFEVDWAIYKETLYVPGEPTKCKGITFSDSNNTMSFDGQIECDALGMLIRTALEGQFTHRFAKAEYSLDGFGPLWGGGMSVMLSEDTGMASEPT